MSFLQIIMMMSGDSEGSQPPIESPAPVPVGNIDILWLGQSNAVDRNSSADNQLQTPDLLYSGKIEGAKYFDGINFSDFATQMNLNTDHIGGYGGAEHRLAREIIYTNNFASLRMVKVAEGGTIIGTGGLTRSWNVNENDLYVEMLSNINASGISHFDIIVFHIGETDSSVTNNANSFEQNMIDIIDSFASNNITFGRFILVQTVDYPYIVTNNPVELLTIKQAKINIANSRNNVVLVDISAPTFKDGIHLDSFGQSNLGFSIYNEVKSFLNT